MPLYQFSAQIQKNPPPSIFSASGQNHLFQGKRSEKTLDPKPSELKNPRFETLRAKKNPRPETLRVRKTLDL